MRILLYFADMVAGHMLKMDTARALSGSLELVLKEMGGVTFVNCYSPAPDTPRSLGTIFTGLMPDVNRCNRRDKWPGHSLSDASPSLFRTAIDCGFQVSALLSMTEIKTQRFLPADCQDDVRIYSQSEDLIQAIKRDPTSHELIFVQDNDCHFAISDHFALKAGHTIGSRRVGKNLRQFLNRIGQDNFDSIFVFSDHGFAPSRLRRRRSQIESSGPQRSKVLLHCWSKELDCPSTSTRLTTTAEIGIVIQSMIQTRSAESAIHALLNSPQNKFVTIEDYSTHTTNSGSPPDVWSVITASQMYIEASDGRFLSFTLSVEGQERSKFVRSEISSAEVDRFREILRAQCESFRDSQELRKKLGSHLAISTYMDSSSRTTGIQAILRIVGIWLKLL